MKKLIIAAVALFTALNIQAQEGSKIKITGYLETYYSYDFNEPANNTRPSFVYSHNRHNEVNLNLGFIKANYDNDKVRANIALMAGTYPNANLAAEPGVLKNIFEANAGVKLSEKENLWLDAGIFSSHIGFESAISKDCWVLTRGIASENTPYYESGAKLTYGTADNKFTATVLYLNGWQRINRLDGNSKPAGGVQLTYKPSSKITLNYSNYIGKEGVNAVAVTRIYHNFYAIAQLTDNFGVTAGFDYATQQKVKGQSAKSEILSPVLIAQYKFDPKWAIAGRAEYYEDKNGIFIATGIPNGFKTTGYSVNLDYSPISNAVVRLEGKVYDSKDKIFVRDINTVNNNAAITASIAVSF
ncbi:outer membrane beta-barrel protein [Pedobacter sp. LMG 31464]|uniref:Outer membrane beta-barrel protein n=1 Tax=Pedobacter planticolens TaxID=2679964 RepID=A0A923DYF5_9SPHI|nr:porin [Pedobacter planticolens]MBB2144294.1 outer membrane beta-barrel protein [Pedobacter planticolens]